MNGLDFNPFPIIILDTETTGLLHDDYASVIELGAVALDHTGYEVGAFDMLIKPVFHIDMNDPGCAKAMEVNGIDVKALENAPDRAHVWDAFVWWACACATGFPVTAYNQRFDRGMMARVGGEHAAEAMPWAPWCLQQKARDCRPAGRKVFKLSKICFELGLIESESVQNHRALDDCRLEAELLREMVRRDGDLS